MHITLVMVLSVNGKSTKNSQPDQSWASEEDQEHLQKLISENNLIVMGGNTYRLAKSHIKPSDGKLRVVVTHNPEEFKDDVIEGQLEFIKATASDLVLNLESRGYENMMLLSGESLNKEFFEEGLIDEMYLTLEPFVSGSGKGMVSESQIDVNLHLIEVNKLNEKGTILLKYKVVE